VLKLITTAITNCAACLNVSHFCALCT